MTTPPGVRDPSRRVIYNPVLGETMEFVKYGYETNGEYAEIIADCAPDGGPPAHYHKSYSESFELLEGELLLEVDGKMVTTEKDKQYLVKPGTVHRFTSTKGGKARIRIEPANEGYEKSLYVSFGLARDGLVNKDGVPSSLVHVGIVALLGDQRLAGKPLINYALTAAGTYGKWTGVEDELVKKYWVE